jgi:hypothetical protein
MMKRGKFDKNFPFTKYNVLYAQNPPVTLFVGRTYYILVHLASSNKRSTGNFFAKVGTLLSNYKGVMNCINR